MLPLGPLHLQCGTQHTQLLDEAAVSLECGGSREGKDC